MVENDRTNNTIPTYRFESRQKIFNNRSSNNKYYGTIAKRQESLVSNLPGCSTGYDIEYVTND